MAKDWDDGYSKTQQDYEKRIGQVNNISQDVSSLSK